MLCIKTGMRNEYDIAKRYASWDRTLVLTGKQTLNDLLEHVPKTCTAIMSFGMCGGLRPGVVVGQTVIASYLIGPNGDNYPCNSAWQHSLFKKTHHFVQPYYSSGKFNQANTQEQRAAIHKKTGAWCIDDESLFVAQFAMRRGIPFIIARNVSDQWDDDVSITSDIMDAEGRPKPMAIASALFKSPLVLVKIGANYQHSQTALELFAREIGPSFGWKE
jgi:adenosylhomocysteine nucleosidase